MLRVKGIALDQGVQGREFVAKAEIQFLKANFSAVNRDHGFAFVLHYYRQVGSCASSQTQHRLFAYNGCLHPTWKEHLLLRLNPFHLIKKQANKQPKDPSSV